MSKIGKPNKLKIIFESKKRDKLAYCIDNREILRFSNEKKWYVTQLNKTAYFTAQCHSTNFVPYLSVLLTQTRTYTICNKQYNYYCIPCIAGQN